MITTATAETSNPWPWEALRDELVVSDITFGGRVAIGDRPLVLSAEVTNSGTARSDVFTVVWTVNGVERRRALHGALRAGEVARDTGVRLELRLQPGLHVVQCAIGSAEGRRPESEFSRELSVRAERRVTVADTRPVMALDPLMNAEPGPGDVMRLLFRGIARRDPDTGELVPELAASWHADTNRRGESRLEITLRPDVRFHDGQPVTVDDLRLSYQTILDEPRSPWHARAERTLRRLRVVSRASGVLALDLKVPAAAVLGNPTLSDLLTMGIVPEHRYVGDTAGFARAPVGTGPFRVQQRLGEHRLRLAAFEDYVAGAPRLDGINIEGRVSLEHVQSLADRPDLDVIVTPYAADIARSLLAAGGRTLLPVRDGDMPLLHIQAKDVRERLPNRFDTAWNAHLWYVASTD